MKTMISAALACVLLATPFATQAHEDPAPSADVLASSYKVGVTTKADIMRLRGKPLYQATVSDGTTVLVYYQAQTHIKGATFVPLIGPFIGGAKSHSTTDTFVFDGAGLLKQYSLGSSNLDCGMTSCK